MVQFVSVLHQACPVQIGGESVSSRCVFECRCGFVRVQTSFDCQPSQIPRMHSSISHMSTHVSPCLLVHVSRGAARPGWDLRHPLSTVQHGDDCWRLVSSCVLAMACDAGFDEIKYFSPPPPPLSLKTQTSGKASTVFVPCPRLLRCWVHSKPALITCAELCSW